MLICVMKKMYINFLHQIRKKMLNEKYLNKVIDFAWADEISFDSIKEQTGLNEKQVIKLMRSNLKPRSFKLWRERVSGRKSKHSKINNIYR